MYMYSKIISGALLGVRSLLINVEVDVSSGIPLFAMVGCAGSEVRESKERIWAAFKNTGLPMPVSRITVNLSPADMHKEGTSYDLPIAIGILESAEIIPAGNSGNILFLGELGLNGEIRTVRGVLPIVTEAAKKGIKECIIPSGNAAEGAIVPGIIVRGAESLTQVLEYLRSPSEEKLPREPACSFENDLSEDSSTEYEEDFADVNGQDAAKRAAVISAAGFHSLLMTGPPGVGKSLIAKRIPSIMPPLSRDESLEVTAIYSVAGKLPPGSTLIRKRGFESPHHTITLPALTGGGSNPRPGAISLAHRSVLFLDELTEFDRKAIDSLRQPLEDHEVHISRSRYSISYPADFLLVCAMNPCPCGYYPDRNRCRCTENTIRKYLGKVSGPILDRIDLCVQMSPVSVKDISAGKKGITSAEMRSRVVLARIAQKKRYEGTSYRFNSEVNGSDLEKYCPLDEKERSFLGEMSDRLGLSVRSYHRIIRVARTIADIEGSDRICHGHILEAASYRPNDEYWKT